MSRVEHGRGRRADDAQKWASILAALAAVGVAGTLTVESTSKGGVVRALDAGSAPPTASAVASAAPALDAGPVLATGPAEVDAGLALSLSLGDAGLALPASAPRSVKMGIVLVTFAGAEGAPNNARPKAQAKELAETLLPMAQADFHQAVTKGDSGSADDIGRIPRGVLEPPVEAVVFALGTSGVSDVIETPKGYWIVKRLD